MEDELVPDYFSRAALFSLNSTDQGLWLDCAFSGFWERKAASVQSGGLSVSAKHNSSLSLQHILTRKDSYCNSKKQALLFLQPDNKPPLIQNNSCYFLIYF